MCTLQPLSAAVAAAACQCPPPPPLRPHPTPILQVWVSGKKWLVTSEYSNIAGNLAVNLVLQRIRVSGALWWLETCRWVQTWVSLFLGGMGVGA